MKNLIKKDISRCLFLCLISCTCHAQLTDLARLEYTFFPQRDSENSFRRLRAIANFPIPLNDDAYLIPGLEYRNVDLRKRDPLPFETLLGERYQNFMFSLGYTDKWESGWRYALQVEFRLASDFKMALVQDDFILGGNAFLIKDKTGDQETNAPKKPWRLIVGLNYSTTAGRPIPLPFVNYYREFAPKWSYVLGIPKTNVKYQVAKAMSLQGLVTLDGFYANLQQNPIRIDTQQIGENISMTTLLSGIGYEWEFIDHFVFYAYAGFTLINDIRIRDGSNNSIFTINDTNTFYSRGGIKFKI